MIINSIVKTLSVALLVLLLQNCKMYRVKADIPITNEIVSLDLMNSIYGFEYLNFSKVSFPDTSTAFIYVFKESKNNSYLLVISTRLNSNEKVSLNNIFRKDTVRLNDSIEIRTEFSPAFLVDDSITTNNNLHIKLKGTTKYFWGWILINDQYYDIITIEDLNDKIIDAYMILDEEFVRINHKGLIRINEECYFIPLPKDRLFFREYPTHWFFNAGLKINEQ